MGKQVLQQKYLKWDFFFVKGCIIAEYHVTQYFCAMRKGKALTVPGVEVTGYAAEGKALARIDGKVYFIEGAVPGDVADIRLSKNKKDWAEGRAIRFHRLSADRQEPFCEHFGTCGGCKWQMLPYSKQLEYKQQEVEDNLRRIGKIELPPFSPIIGADPDRGYRNKLEFTFSNRSWLSPEEINALPEKSGDMQDPAFFKPALGFHVPRLFDKIVDIRHCHLMPEPVNRIRNWVRAFTLEQGFPYYDIRRHEGWLRNLTFRLCTTGELMVNLVTAPGWEVERALLLDQMSEAFPEITSLYFTVNHKVNDSLHDLDPVLFKGQPWVTEKLGRLYFRIGPKSFFQTNTRQAERLYEVTRAYAGLSGHETLYDLYCGTGSIGLFCSEGAGKLVGVEVIEAAVQDARENAAANGIAKARFFTGDVVDVCNDNFFQREGRPDVIITDPPRAGMHEALVRKLLEIGAPRVVYVSCNSATQARDLQALDNRYQVTAVQSVDMFPHTHHIENVAQLNLRNLS
jgi:23S rRNA (uracil1939-C5)-methyltransferase